MFKPTGDNAMDSILKAVNDEVAFATNTADDLFKVEPNGSVGFRVITTPPVTEADPRTSIDLVSYSGKLSGACTQGKCGSTVGAWDRTETTYDYVVTAESMDDLVKALQDFFLTGERLQEIASLV